MQVSNILCKKEKKKWNRACTLQQRIGTLECYYYSW